MIKTNSSRPWSLVNFTDFIYPSRHKQNENMIKRGEKTLCEFHLIIHVYDCAV